MDKDSLKQQPISVLEDTVTVAEVAAEIEKPTAPRVPTRKEIGEWRRTNITITHGTVKACGHRARFSATQQPKNNCAECWTAWFMTHCDLEGLHVVITKQGVRALIAQRGTKFVKMFRGFLNARLMPMLNAEAAKQEAVTIEGGTIGNKDGNRDAKLASTKSAI
jgi:hypothetical protein